MRASLFATVAILCASIGAHSAAAQPFPSRPVTLVVPLGVGGSTDVIGRIVAEGLRSALGQPVVVENTTGAGGTIGMARVARAAGDGYTIGIGQWGTNVATGAVYPLTFDLLNDFEPIALIATQPFLVVGKKGTPARDLKEFIAYLKAHEGKVSQGNSGVGTPSHIAGLLFQKAIGAHFAMVPYRGAGQSLQDLVAGNLDILLDTPALSLPQVRAGAIKAYAVTAKTRLATAPEIPTAEEAGLPGFHFSFWHALWAPKGTPRGIIASLNAAVVKTLADPVTRAKLLDLSQDIFSREQQTPEALRVFQKAEIEKWWPIIKATGIRAE